MKHSLDCCFLVIQLHLIMAVRYLRTEICLRDICGWTFADRILPTGHLWMDICRRDICGQTFANGTFVDETFEKFEFFEKILKNYRLP